MLRVRKLYNLTAKHQQCCMRVCCYFLHTNICIYHYFIFHSTITYGWIHQIYYSSFIPQFPCLFDIRNITKNWDIKFYLRPRYNNRDRKLLGKKEILGDLLVGVPLNTSKMCLAQLALLPSSALRLMEKVHEFVDFSRLKNAYSETLIRSIKLGSKKVVFDEVKKTCILPV